VLTGLTTCLKQYPNYIEELLLQLTHQEECTSGDDSGSWLRACYIMSAMAEETHVGEHGKLTGGPDPWVHGVGPLDVSKDMDIIIWWAVIILAFAPMSIPNMPSLILYWPQENTWFL